MNESPGPPCWNRYVFDPCLMWHVSSLSSFRPPLLIRRGRFSDEDATRMWSHCLRTRCRRRQQQWHQQRKHYVLSLPVVSLACPRLLPLWPLTLALTLPQVPASRRTLMTSPSAQPAPPAPLTHPSEEEEKKSMGGLGGWGIQKERKPSSSFSL